MQMQMSIRIKCLDKENFIFNTEKIGYDRTIMLLKKQIEEQKEVMNKTIMEYEHNTRLLVKRIKRMKKEQTAIEAEREEYKKQFTDFSNYFISLKKEIQKSND